MRWSTRSATQLTSTAAEEDLYLGKTWQVSQRKECRWYLKTGSGPQGCNWTCRGPSSPRDTVLVSSPHLPAIKLFVSVRFPINLTRALLIPDVLACRTPCRVLRWLSWLCEKACIVLLCRNKSSLFPSALACDRYSSSRKSRFLRGSSGGLCFGNNFLGLLRELVLLSGC